MSAHEMEGKRKKVEGQVRDTMGKMTGDKSEQIRGKAEKVEGKVEESLGKAKRKAER
jgi:uncharacterized protein YjbJ (UPF0337 family)